VDVTLEQEGVSDENMCNGHGTHSLTSVLSRQRGTRRVTVQHLRERHVIVVGQRLRCCMFVVVGSRGTVVSPVSQVAPTSSSVLSILYRVPLAARLWG
jgi:hypothetical protein